MTATEIKIVSGERLKELKIWVAAKNGDGEEYPFDAVKALEELELYRLQKKKRDLMIRKAQLLKQNKALLEKKKEGKK